MDGFWGSLGFIGSLFIYMVLISGVIWFFSLLYVINRLEGKRGVIVNRIWKL